MAHTVATVTFRVLLLAVILLLIMSCSNTEIEEVNVITIAGEGCSVQRGKTVEAGAEGSASAQVVQQAGEGGGRGSLVELLASNADCTERNREEQQPEQEPGVGDT